MTLYPKKNGKGYITSYQVIFGSREARNLKLVNEKGITKEIVNAEIVDTDIIQIKLKDKVLI